MWNTAQNVYMMDEKDIVWWASLWNESPGGWCTNHNDEAICHTQTCMHTHIHTYTHTNMCTHTHTQMHTHKQTCACAHIHTHRHCSFKYTSPLTPHDEVTSSWNSYETGMLVLGRTKGVNLVQNPNWGAVGLRSTPTSQPLGFSILNISYANIMANKFEKKQNKNKIPTRTNNCILNVEDV